MPVRTVSCSSCHSRKRTRAAPRGAREWERFLIIAGRFAARSLSPLADRRPTSELPLSLRSVSLTIPPLSTSTSGRAGAPLGLCPCRCQAGTSWWCRRGLAGRERGARGGPRQSELSLPRRRASLCLLLWSPFSLETSLFRAVFARFCSPSHRQQRGSVVLCMIASQNYAISEGNGSNLALEIETRVATAAPVLF